MEFVRGGELFTYIQSEKHRNPSQPFSEKIIRFYAAELIIALEQIHNLGIIYRDLKPENVLVDEKGHIKLADFGLSKKDLSGTMLTYSVCGTPEYVAPEILTKKGHNKNIDWWSLGIILFEMYKGSTPASGKTVPEIIQILTNNKTTNLDKLEGCTP